MNILFTRFPLESAFGGAEVQTMSLMRGLKEHGHEISFLGSCPVLLELCREHGIPAVHVEIGPPPVTKWGAVSFLWRRGAMRARLRECFGKFAKLDAVVMLSLTEKLLLTPLALQQGKNIYWLEHDRIGRWLKKNPWLGHLLKLSQHVTTIGVSDLSTQLYVDLGWPADRVVSIPNGIDPERFEAKPVERMTDDFTIGCVARLTSDKGVDVLLTAIEHLPDVSLDIIGQGPEEVELKRQILVRNLSNRVSVLPNHDDLAQFYQSIDLLVLPARDHDPFGLVAAEAMLLSTPVIVTDACGIASYLQNGSDAVVVPAGSVEYLTRAIDKLQDDEIRLKIALEGQKTARKKFLLERMVEQYEELLK